jgi:hypothetical protein
VLLILALSAAVSAAWLFRDELLRAVRPKVVKVREALTDEDTGRPTLESLRAARDRIDSLHGWSLDSIGLRRAELASLLLAGMPEGNKAYFDSVEVVAGGDRLTVRARLQLARVSPSRLGPLAGALEPWEWVTLAGPLRMRRAGRATWQVELMSLRSFDFPAGTSRELVTAALPEVDDGAIEFRLPDGVMGMEIRAGGAMVFRKEAR